MDGKRLDKKSASGLSLAATTLTHSETAPDETTRADHSRLPEVVKNDPRWRSIWTKLLAPLPEKDQEAAA